MKQWWILGLIIILVSIVGWWGVTQSGYKQYLAMKDRVAVMDAKEEERAKQYLVDNNESLKYSGVWGGRLPLLGIIWMWGNEGLRYYPVTTPQGQAGRRKRS